MVIPSKEQLRSLLFRINKLLSRIDWHFLLQTALVFASFVVPLLIIYFFDLPGGPVSFDDLWKGRAPYLLFIWLLLLEAILNWKNLKERNEGFWTWKTILAIMILILPTIYSLGISFFGWKAGILGLGTAVGVPAERYTEWFLTHSWFFSFEYVLFTVFFVVSIWLLHGFRGLKSFAVSSFFLGGVGVFYMIDTFYPYGTFTILQSFVPVTVYGAASILNLLGYGTQIFSGGSDGLGLNVIGANNSYSALISWSCAGSHSLFIYSFMIMLFLRGTSISRTRKIIYIALGAAGTFFVNILRIVAILTAGVSGGSSLATTFHEFYGEFFFIAWMFIYLSIIFLSETRLIGKIRSIRGSNQPLTETTQPSLP